mmetsp:Transcript_65367/g.116538  ORF Transcript_65367/g.116538 Transcript_65367/m.116538 type:complete len:98 (-) Transcript_65367:455-748(-)
MNPPNHKSLEISTCRNQMARAAAYRFAPDRANFASLAASFASSSDEEAISSFSEESESEPLLDSTAVPPAGLDGLIELARALLEHQLNGAFLARFAG